jgi:hypothetical protein
MGQPDRDLVARREEALARLAVTTEALQVLEQTLRAEPGLPPAVAQALLAGARALCPVAASAHTELAVSADPQREWVVLVGSDEAGPLLHLSRRSDEQAPWSLPTPPTGSPSPDGAVQLADVLRNEPLR